MTPYWSNGIASLYQADARQIPLPGQSVHCAVTSPPYFGLRVYRAEGKVIGLEETPAQWLASMLEVMAEVWRVLRDDGILWVNLGDSYGGSGKGQNADGTHAAKHGEKQHTSKGTLSGGLPANNNHAQEDGRSWSGQNGQLLGIPWRFALAMQEAGWILRGDPIWSKKSCMPESLAGTRWVRHDELDEETMTMEPCPGCPKCQDDDGLVLHKGSWRCTSSHEYIFQFVKQMGYFGDGIAVQTPHQHDGRTATAAPLADGSRENYSGADGHERWPGSGANRRSVWSDIKPEPLSDMNCPACGRSFTPKVYRRFPKFEGHPICPRCEEALVSHYATFPSDLPRLCIQASTSEAGVCADCGAQWARVVEHMNEPASTKTLSWRPTCTCNADKVPATVLDPFCGTATTMLAAMRLGRRSVGVDLSSEYLNMAIKRLSGQTLPLGAL